MSQLSDDDLKALAAASQGLENVPAINPHDLPIDHPVRRQLLMQLEFVDPVANARMARNAESVQPISINAEMARRGLTEMTQDSHAELMRSDPDYVQKHQEAAIQQEADLISKLDRMTAETQRSNLLRQYGSEAAVDRHLAEQDAKTKAAAEEAERRAADDARLNQRMAEKRQQQLNEARMQQSNVVMPAGN